MHSISNSLDILVRKLSEHEKEVSLSGFEKSYGVGIKKNYVFIPDFNTGYIYEFNLKNNKTRILYRNLDNLKSLSMFKRSSNNNFKKTIIKPHSIFFDNNMNMYISEMGDKDKRVSGKISVFNSDLKLLKDIGKDLHNNYSLVNPIMICKSKNIFYVTENGSNKILRFNKNYDFLDWIGKFENYNNGNKNYFLYKKKNFINIDLKNPHAVKIDANNNIYIVDTGNNRILRFAKNGDFKGWIGKKDNGQINDNWQKKGSSIKGSEPGAFNAPCDLVIVDNFMYVSEVQNNRIVKISLKGKNYGWIGVNKETNEYMWSKDISNKFEFYHPFGIKIKNKTIFIADRGNYKIRILYSNNLF